MKFKAIEKAIKEDGFKMVILLRLCPLIPFNLLNYLLGVTSITAKDNIMALLGMIPGTIVYVYLGGTISNLSDIASSGSLTSNYGTIALLIIGTVLAFCGVCFISYKAKMAINKALED